MTRPQFRLRSLFILTAIVAVGCLVGRWIGFIPDHPYLFFVILLELFAGATLWAIVRANDV